MRTFISALLLVLVMLASGLDVQAENSRMFGDYRIHYNAFNASMLEPKVANAYGIRRGSTHGVINITVQQRDNMGGYKPVMAEVKTVASTLYGQRLNIDMQEAREGEVVYYLGQIRFQDQDQFDFEVDVKPEGADRSYKVEFSQQFFSN